MEAILTQPQLDSALLIATGMLVLTLIVGLLRALVGPTLEDRLSAALLVGTGGVAYLALLMLLLDMPALLDVALLLALLAAVAAAAMTREEAADD